MKIDDLYELDRDQLLLELMDATGIQITDDYKGNHDLTVSSWNTADDYNVYVIRHGCDYDLRSLNFESDVYYYEPTAEVIIERFYDLDEGDSVYVEELEWLEQDEDAIISYLEDNYSNRYECE